MAWIVNFQSCNHGCVDVDVWVSLAVGLAGASLGATVSAFVALRQVRRVTDREIHRVSELLASRDQDWYWTAEWQAGERAADDDLAAGRSTVHLSEGDFFAALDAIPAANEPSPAGR